jgi:hypothetical protein
VVIPYRFRIKRDTAANFAAANTLLLEGEFGLELDTGKLKIGDGVTAWNSLGYYDTSDVPEGSNLYFTAQRVRDTLLTGLSTATNAVIAATDSVLVALGKLQAQISAVIADYVPKARTISTTAPLTGGGDLSADRTLAITAATTLAAGSMSAADKSKLDGVQAGATANSTDAQLRDRATHTGTQTAATVSDFTAAAKAAAVADTITDGVTDVAPSQNAVFDALAAKSTHADLFSDFVVSGLLSPTSANLSTTLAAGVAYVTGLRVVKAAETFTYAASSNTYEDMDVAGVITRSVVSNSNLISNGTFDVDTVGWTPQNSATLTWQSPGIMRVTSDANAFGGGVQGFATVVGQTYRIRGDLTGTNSSAWLIKSDSATDFGVNRVDIITSASAPTAGDGVFTATATTTYVWLLSAATAGSWSEWDNILVQRGAPAVTANTLRLQEVVTNASAVTGVTRLAAVSTTRDISFLGKVGIGGPAATARLSLSEKLRMFETRPPSAPSTTDAGYLFGTTIPSGLVTEVSGAVLSYCINVPQIGPRDTARVGGIFRLDTRAGANKFVVFGYPLGTSTPIEHISVSLENGETHLAQNGGNVGIGYPAGSSIIHRLQVDGNIFATSHIRPGNYTVATVPSASVAGAGAMIYVSDEVGGGVPAFSDGTNWRRVTDRAVVS